MPTENSPTKKRTSAYTFSARGHLLLAGDHDAAAVKAIDAVKAAEKVLVDAGFKVAFTKNFGSIMVAPPAPAPAETITEK